MYPNRHVSKTPILHFFIYFFIFTSLGSSIFPLKWLEHPWFERMMYLHQSTHMQPTHKPKLKQQQISTKSNTMTQHTHMCTRVQPHQHQHFNMLQTFAFFHFCYCLETHTVSTIKLKHSTVHNSHFINWVRTSCFSNIQQSYLHAQQTQFTDNTNSSQPYDTHYRLGIICY